MAVAFVGLAPVGEIDLRSPLASAFQFRQMGSLAYLVGIGAVGNTLTSVLSNFLIQPRIVIRMASDGFFPEKFGTVDENGVPRTALFGTIGFSTFTALFMDFEPLADIVSVASLVALSVVCMCVVVSGVGLSLSLLYEAPLALTLTLGSLLSFVLWGIAAQSLRNRSAEEI